MLLQRVVGVSGAWWFITITSLGPSSLCVHPTPHIFAGMVVEIDMGTQVITHSPNAIHFAAHIVAIYRYLASGSRRQCLFSTDYVCHLLIMFLSRFRACSKFKFTCILLLKSWA